jgi:hypothetical protein
VATIAQAQPEPGAEVVIVLLCRRESRNGLARDQAQVVQVARDSNMRGP